MTPFSLFCYLLQSFISDFIALKQNESQFSIHFHAFHTINTSSLYCHFRFGFRNTKPFFRGA